MTRPRGGGEGGGSFGQQEIEINPSIWITTSTAGAAQQQSKRKRGGQYQGASHHHQQQQQRQEHEAATLFVDFVATLTGSH